MKHIGQLIQQRREAMGMTQSALARTMGGYPSASLMSRIEAGEVELTPSSAAKYAEVLRLPRDLMLNAGGFATPDQHAAALGEIEKMLGADIPVMLHIPVLDPEHPDYHGAPKRQREVRKAEDLFIIDLEGRQHAPYVGEVMASRERKPKDGQGVIAEVAGKLGAWTFHTARTTGDWLENGNGEKVAKGFKVWGTIIRYVTAFEME